MAFRTAGECRSCVSRLVMHNKRRDEHDPRPDEHDGPGLPSTAANTSMAPIAKPEASRPWYLRFSARHFAREIGDGLRGDDDAEHEQNPMWSMAWDTCSSMKYTRTKRFHASVL